MTMNWDLVQDVFSRCLELPADQQAGELAALDEAERAEVQRLLDSHFKPGEFLETPLLSPTGTEMVASDWTPPAAMAQGQVFGAYKLEKVIGEGGMGAVYLARRADDEFSRKVAVKLIRRHRDPEMLARFRNERQILAGLEHPNIGRLYDGGSVDGQPYLVMEYVEGVRIDEHCRAQELQLKERLRLFQQVCSAVSYAHRNLLVHRDLKPANILVGSDGVPKLLDFGIAKSLEDDPGTTQTNQRPMTPAYASPEQVRGAPISTSSDVYSLGVILYELLTDSSPYQLDDSSDLTLKEAIRDQQPTRPSTVGVKELRGDLDTIIMTALRKEPDRRYSSVDALSRDIDRFLAHLPIEARGDSFSYRIRKFTRRNRWGVAAGSAFMIFALVFVAALVRQTRISSTERDRAQQALGAMIEAFKAADPEEALGRELTAREILDQGAEKVRRSLAGDPVSQASLLAAMAEVYVSLGVFDQAEALHKEALALRRGGELEGDSLYLLGELELARREYRAALDFFYDAANLLDRDSLNWSRSIRGSGLALINLQEPDNNGEPMLTIALNRLSTDFERSDPEILRCLEGLAVAAVAQANYDRAGNIYQEVVEIKRTKGQGPSLGRSLIALATVRQFQRRIPEMNQLLDESLPLLKKVMGQAQNPYVAEALVSLAKLHFLQGKTDLAEAVSREILAMRDRAARMTIAEALHNLGPILVRSNKIDEAKLFTNEALGLHLALFGSQHDLVAGGLHSLGRIAHLEGDLDSARSYQQQSAEVLERIYGNEHPQMAFVWLALGEVEFEENGCEAAEPWFRRAVEVRKKFLGEGHSLTTYAAQQLENCP